jgi:urease accessory protein UreF
VRLGAVTPKGAQQLLTQLHPSIEHAAKDACRRTLGELHASIPELETHAMSHRRPGVRLFAT